MTRLQITIEIEIDQPLDDELENLLQEQIQYMASDIAQGNLTYSDINDIWDNYN